ncbi:N-acetylmuramoyl-L-alanine amidase [Nocardioides sp. URHA0020]|uniref:N-acetylmuramoyl-L-alanine amidase n=1 Tax=Nocardioides sp. URHA0020 TaxID=1380392 RepID=UPI00048B0638|nr:N-acetylmuramoyl-L-alanine amidase [Nocardioides sp. URHA0020]
MNSPLLVLDPGHGGSQPAGASSPNRGTGAGGLLEKEVALDVARRARDRLTRDHVVVLTRDSDTNLSLAERADTAKKLHAAAFVSVHFSGSDPAVDRTDVVVATTASASSRALADNIKRRVGAATGSGGDVLRADLGQLAADRHDPATAACLVEIASLAAPHRAQLLADPAYRDQLAEALAIAIRESVAGGAAPMARPQWVAAQGYGRAASIYPPETPSDYSITGLVSAAAIWADWFLRRATWEAGVPDSEVMKFPHSAICQLKLTSTTGQLAWGTGFYIADEVLLTCGHNFYDAADGWETASIEVLPAYSPRASTYPTKSFTVTWRDNVHPKWAASNDSGFDLAVLPVPGLPSQAGNFTLANVSLSQEVPIVVCGYGKVDGTAFETQGQRMDGAHIGQADYDLVYYPMMTEGGHSGSPVFSGRMVIGVHTGPKPDLRMNRAVLLTPEKEDWIISKAGSGVAFGQSLGRRGSALGVDSTSTQSAQSDQVRVDVGRSVARAEAGGDYTKVHHDSARLNFGIGSWTLARIATVLDTIEGYAAANGLTADLVAPFGGQAGFDAVRAACRTGQAEPLSAAQESQLQTMARITSLHPAQDLQLAADVKADLDWIGSSGTNPDIPWYPFIDGGMGAITEIAAHVLVHALHQSGRGATDGSNGLPKRFKEVIAGFGGEAKMGADMVSGAVTERMWLEALAARVVANVRSDLQAGVTNRYTKVFADWGSSGLSYYFTPAS